MHELLDVLDLFVLQFWTWYNLIAYIADLSLFCMNITFQIHMIASWKTWKEVSESFSSKTPT